MFTRHVGTPMLRLSLRTLARSESTNVARRPASFPRTHVLRTHVLRTHFLTIPFYEHSTELQKKLAAFRDGILACGIRGLTADSVVPRLFRFLELRLGSLSIQGFKGEAWDMRRPRKKEATVQTRAEHKPIPFDEVKELLQELKTPIQEILSANGGDGRLHMPLGNLRPLLHGPREYFNPNKVNILLLEPFEGSASDPLRAVNELVFKRFKQAGMWVDTRRPSTLSLTLANVRYFRGRAIKPREERVQFSVIELYNSEAFRAVEGGPPVAEEGWGVDAASGRPVLLGDAIASSLRVIPVTAPEPEGSVSMMDELAKPDYTLAF